MLSNPYHPEDSYPKLSTRISPTDYQYLKNLLPFQHHLFSFTLASLFKGLVDELRSLEKQNGEPFQPALGPSDPTLILFEQLVSRRASRSSDRPPAGPRDDTGGADSLHQTLLPPAEQRSGDEESCNLHKIEEALRRWEEKRGQRSPGDGPIAGTD